MFSIRRFQPQDHPRLRAITVTCFDGVSIDQNVEARFGEIAGSAWQERKAAQIDDDCAANPEGIFVAEVEGEIAGFLTSRLLQPWRIGWIVNLAVEPRFQQRGIARALIERALAYFRENGMAAVKIEAMVQNEVASRFYANLGFHEVARTIHFFQPLDRG